MAKWLKKLNQQKLINIQTINILEKARRVSLSRLNHPLPQGTNGSLDRPVPTHGKRRETSKVGGEHREFGGLTPGTEKILSGWWLNQPLCQNGFIFPNFRDENKQIFELPPPSCFFGLRSIDFLKLNMLIFKGNPNWNLKTLHCAKGFCVPF